EKGNGKIAPEEAQPAKIANKTQNGSDKKPEGKGKEEAEAEREKEKDTEGARDKTADKTIRKTKGKGGDNGVKSMKKWE
ncbi:hypothetical protein ACQ1ZA_16125, partial [Enterococcus faecalis]